MLLSEKTHTMYLLSQPLKIIYLPQSSWNMCCALQSPTNTLIWKGTNSVLPWITASQSLLSTEKKPCLFLNELIGKPVEYRLLLKISILFFIIFICFHCDYVHQSQYQPEVLRHKPPLNPKPNKTNSPRYKFFIFAAKFNKCNNLPLKFC